MTARPVNQNTSPAEQAERVDAYIDRTGFKLSMLGRDAATISLRPELSDTVESDMDNVMGFIGDRITMEDRCTSAYALGLIIGAAMQKNGLELPEQYAAIIDKLSESDVDG